ncbi:enolase-phosphatase E1 [Bisporella sp. PMI_857]|nr:enolase-phosphatase E1 [Bisporella sp. PMI_857]
MDIEVVLLDIEGTVCPISFVKDVLFPYALQALPSTLSTEWDSPSFAPYRDAFPPEHRSSPSAFSAHVHELMSQDLKIPYLKALQGYLWTHGYESGELVCPLFPDVEPKLREWYMSGKKIVIYSSGSVSAQKNLFQYTNSSPPDLRPLITDYFDTVNAGPKTEKSSYEKIVSASPGHPVERWLFLSDNIKEVRAAKEAGMQSFVVVREGNAELSKEEKEGQVLISSFQAVMVSRL